MFNACKDWRMLNEYTKAYFKRLDTGKTESKIEISNSSSLMDLKLDFKKLCRSKKCKSITEYINMLEKKCLHSKVIEVLDDTEAFERLVDYMNEYPMNTDKSSN